MVDTRAVNAVAPPHSTHGTTSAGDAYPRLIEKWCDVVFFELISEFPINVVPVVFFGKQT